MPDSLPEPRVVPTPASSPRMSLMMAATLALGVTSLIVSLGNPLAQAVSVQGVPFVDARR